MSNKNVFILSYFILKPYILEIDFLVLCKFSDYSVATLDPRAHSLSHVQYCFQFLLCFTLHCK
jgi:hypothetical protein